MIGDKPIFNMVGGDVSKDQLGEIISSRFSTDDEISFERDAKKFYSDSSLDGAINVALATRRPLLLTGEPGTGKTVTAYYVAQELGLGEVLHFQVKSDSKHTDLLYYFDAVAYLREAYKKSSAQIALSEFIEKRELWHAYEAAKTRILLIDEIDKAPRDFPNDLLLELDRHQFVIRETGEKVEATMIPIVVITSNSERYLPDAFLRRCVFHHMRLDEETVRRAVEAHRSEFARLSDGIIRMAITRIFELRDLGLQRPPATSEALLWLNVLDKAERDENAIEQGIDKLNHMGTLIKTPDDLKVVKQELRVALGAETRMNGSGE